MRYFFYLGILLLLTSCFTQKRAVYNLLEEVTDTTLRESVQVVDPVIQKNDLLSIQVYSASTDPQIDALYNLPLQTGAAQGGQQGGYLVDARGEIEMPRIGKVQAEGLTKQELSDVIKGKLSTQLSQPSVIIRFLNFRITVLGEVGSPGLLNIPTERLTVLEALGMAGGVTEFGKIKEVKILRQNNGITKTGILDLTSKKIFQSPYYQLQQNDVVLVDQTAVRLRQSEQQRIAQQLGFALSIITSIALLYNIFQ